MLPERMNDKCDAKKLSLNDRNEVILEDLFPDDDERLRTKISRRKIEGKQAVNFHEKWKILSCQVTNSVNYPWYMLILVFGGTAL